MLLITEPSSICLDKLKGSLAVSGDIQYFERSFVSLCNHYLPILWHEFLGVRHAHSFSHAVTNCQPRGFQTAPHCRILGSIEFISKGRMAVRISKYSRHTRSIIEFVGTELEGTTQSSRDMDGNEARWRMDYVAGESQASLAYKIRVNHIGQIVSMDFKTLLEYWDSAEI